MSQSPFCLAVHAGMASGSGGTVPFFSQAFISSQISPCSPAQRHREVYNTYGRGGATEWIPLELTYYTEGLLFSLPRLRSGLRFDGAQGFQRNVMRHGARRLGCGAPMARGDFGQSGYRHVSATPRLSQSPFCPALPLGRVGRLGWKLNKRAVSPVFEQSTRT